MDDLRALLAAATPGPWIEDSADQPTAPFGTIFRDDADDWDDRTWLFDPREGTTEDAQLIVAAVNALPVLLDVVEAAKAVWDRCGDAWDPDDLDPESSLAMSVPMRARDAAALAVALRAIAHLEGVERG